MEFMEFVRRVRQARGLSRAEAATRSGLSYSTWANVESGLSPGTEARGAMLETLGVVDVEFTEDLLTLLDGPVTPEVREQIKALVR